ncbi:unnamed protein product [Victoria cruziana]
MFIRGSLWIPRHFSLPTCLFLSLFNFRLLLVTRSPLSHCPVMLSFRLLVVVLLPLLLAIGSDGGGADGGCVTSRVMVAATTWCVAKSSMDNTSLQEALDYACGVGGADCSPITSDGLCFLPNTLQAHASFAMNSYYQRSGHAPSSCDFSGTGVIAMTDPSYGSCIYPSSASMAGLTSPAAPSTTQPTPTTVPTFMPPNAPVTTPPTVPVTMPWTTPTTTPTTIPITTPTTIPITTPITSTPTLPTYNPANPSPITSMGGGLSPPGPGSPTASNAMIAPRSISHPIALVTLLLLPIPLFSF